MGDSNNSPTQKINYFNVGEYLEAIRYDYFITITIINRDYILIIFNIDHNIYKKNLLKKTYNSNIIIFNFSIISIDKFTCKLIVIS